MPEPSPALLPSPTLYPEAVTAEPAARRWHIVAVNLRTGEELGEVRHATNRSVTPRPINGLGTASLRLKANDALVPEFAEGETRGVKFYEESQEGIWQLRFVGMVTSYEEVHAGGGGAQEDGVQLGFTHPAALLEDRMVGKSRTGYSRGTSLVPVERGEIMAHALDTTNAESASPIQRGTITSSGSNTYVANLLFKPVLELWDDLSGPLDGPDWEIESIEPLSSGLASGRLNTAAIIGSTKSNAVWEYGTGRANVKTWRRIIDPKTVANKVWHLPTGYPDNTSDEPVSSTNTTSVADRGLQEALATADVGVLALRNQLVQQHVAVRRVPRQVITFEPRMEVVRDLRYRTDYIEGDFVHFHAMQRYPVYDSSGTFVAGYSEQDLVDSIFRIRAVTFNLNENGDATPVFTLTPETTA